MLSQSNRINAAMYACVLVIAGAAGPAFAQASSGWYIGVGAGLGGPQDPDCAGLSRCDRTGTEGRLTVGRRLNDRFSLEGSYVDLRGIGGALADPVLGTVTADFSGRGLELAGLVHTREFNGFSGYAKLGLASMTATARIRFAGLEPFAMEYSDRKTVPVAGFGASYQINPRLALQAGYDWRRLALGKPVLRTVGGEQQTILERERQRVHSLTVGLRLDF